jgi:hypothetical protein
MDFLPPPSCESDQYAGLSDAHSCSTEDPAFEMVDANGLIDESVFLAF